jgi:hypothetical protein
MGQSRRFDSLPVTSGLTSETDIVRPPRHVRLVPTADMVRRHAPTLVRRFGIEHVVRCQRTSNTFERKLTHRLDRDRVFDRCEDTWTD